MRVFLKVTLALACTAQAYSAETTRPNVVLIFADDLGYCFSELYGCDAVPTPDIQQGNGPDPIYPSWCRQITWHDYASKRYDRVKAALQSLLRPASYADEEASTPRGWMLANDRIIVWEPLDAFGRRSFGWDDVPSTLIDSDTTQGNYTFLVRTEVEEFLGSRIHAPGRFSGLRRLFGR